MHLDGQPGSKAPAPERRTPGEVAAAEQALRDTRGEWEPLAGPARCGVRVQLEPRSRPAGHRPMSVACRSNAPRVMRDPEGTRLRKLASPHGLEPRT